MKDKNPNPLPPSVCPVCGYVTDAASCATREEARPEAGDITLCLKCGEIGVFDKDLKVREACISDLLDLSESLFKKVTLLQDRIRKERLIK